MARDMRGETEYGLPVLPDAKGNEIADGAKSPETITGLTDAQAIKDGAGGSLGNNLFTLGAELREIYAEGEGGNLGPQTPLAGTN